MTITLAVVADYASTEGGKLSVIGIFDRLNARQFPTTHNFALAVRIRFEGRERKEAELRISVTGPNEEAMGSAKQKIRLPEPKDGYEFGHINQVISFVNMPFPHAGVYRFHIECQEASADAYLVAVLRSR